MHESQLNDKIKYWQYHLKKNKKGEVKEGLKKTPEKKKSGGKSMYQSNNSNPFLNTIDKLKSYLQQSELSKTTEFNFKKEKQIKKVCSKEIELPYKTSKSMSMQGTMKLKQNSNKSKADIVIETNSKSKSKSKSKGKLLKPKKSKEVKPAKEGKQVKVGKMEKMLSPRKSSKKKKTKSPSKKIFSIKIQAPPMQQWQLEKRWLQTVNLKTQKSRYETETTNFRVWEEYQQTRFNQKRKHLKTISTYFHSFVTLLNYNNRFVSPRGSFTERMSSIPFSLSNMIRNQESKLLDIRRQLNRLKDSNNLNESLELIINKVNDNISSLKKIEYCQKDELIPPTTELDTSHANKDIPDQANSFRSSQSIHSSHQTSFSSQPQIRQPILMMDSLMISNDSPEPSHRKNFKEELKQESSLNLVDSKFMNVTLNHTSMIENQPVPQINLSLIKSHQKALMNFENHQSTLLLSASAKSESKLLSDSSELDDNVPYIQFTVNEVKFFPSIQEHIKEEAIESPPSQQENHILLKSINNILNDHANQLEIERRDRNKSRYSSQQINHLFQMISNDLIVEFLPFFGAHQSFLEKTFEFLSSLPGQQIEQLTPIQYTNQYLFSLANFLLTEADQKFDLLKRISQPLGVEPLVNLRYIRISLIDQYALDGFSPYSEQDYNTQIQEQMASVEERADVITKDNLDVFDERFGNQDISYQIILNRCLYEFLNNILDKFRPFGSTGIPTFYSFIHHYKLPSLATIKRKVQQHLQKYMNIRLGYHLNNILPAFDMQKQIIDALNLNQIILRQQIQQDFESQDEDSMQRYELMLMIQNYILSQQCWVLSKRMKGEKAI